MKLLESYIPYRFEYMISNSEVENPISNFPKVKFKEAVARISFGSIFPTREAPET